MSSNISSCYKVWAAAADVNTWYLLVLQVDQSWANYTSVPDCEECQALCRVIIMDKDDMSIVIMLKYPGQGRLRGIDIGQWTWLSEASADLCTPNKSLSWHGWSYDDKNEGRTKVDILISHKHLNINVIYIYRIDRTSSASVCSTAVSRTSRSSTTATKVGAGCAVSLDSLLLRHLPPLDVGFLINSQREVSLGLTGLVEMLDNIFQADGGNCRGRLEKILLRKIWRTEEKLIFWQTWNSLAIPGVTFFRYSATSEFSSTSDLSFSSSESVSSLLSLVEDFAGLLDEISVSVEFAKSDKLVNPD